MATPTVTIPIPPVPSAQTLDDKGAVVSQPWQQWFVNLRDKVNQINDVVAAISGSGSTLGAFNSLSPLTTNGDILTYNSGSNVRLPVGLLGQVLMVVAGMPSWQTPSVYVSSYFGTGTPSTLYNNGDLYFNTSTTPYTGYVQNAGVWQQFS